MHFVCEEYVIGAILVDAKALDLARPIVQPGDFESEPCRAIYQAALKLADEGKAIDAAILQTQAAAMGYPLDYNYLLQLMEITPTATNAGIYAERVHSDAQRRRLQAAAQAVVEDSTTPLAELAAQLRDAVDRAKPTRDRPRTSRDWCSRVMQLMGQQQQIISTGYKSLDDVLGGFLNGGLYIVAARPGVGKTCLLLNLAEQVKGPALFVSMEMSGEQLLFRRLAMRSGVPVMTQVKQELDEAQNVAWAQAVYELTESPLHMVDDVLTLAEIESEARAIDGLKAVFVDYLQLAQTGTSADDAIYNRVTAVSNGLKHLARRLNVPVIAASQLKRPNGSSNKKDVDKDVDNVPPTLESLRDSGAIEQDADGVVLVSKEGLTPGGRSMLLDVAKNRHGPTDKVHMAFHLASGVFEE